MRACWAGWSLTNIQALHPSTNQNRKWALVGYPPHVMPASLTPILPNPLIGDSGFGVGMPSTCSQRPIHVTEALWMKGVWSWANHIQTIHSQSPILRSTKLLKQTGIFFRRMKVWQIKNQYLQDEEVDCSSHRIRTFVWDLKVPIGFPKFPMEFPWFPMSTPSCSHSGKKWPLHDPYILISSKPRIAFQLKLWCWNLLGLYVALDSQALLTNVNF